MGSFVLAALVVAALISIIYGRSAGRKFMDGVFTLIGAFIIFIVVVAVMIYVDDKRQTSEAKVKVLPAASPPAAAPQQPAAYQPQAHTCPSCNGAGSTTCTSCQGTGYSAQSRQQSEGMPGPPDCPRCGMTTISGAGVGRVSCARCSGSGQVWW